MEWWQTFKVRIKEQWADLTDDDIDSARGNWDQLVDAITHKTGETAESIENRLKALAV